jgi:hypothetical protein
MADPLAAVKQLGIMFAKAGMAGCDRVEQGEFLALACMAERKSPFDIVRTYHIVDGKLSMRADAMLARFREAGGKVKWEQFDDKAAVGAWSIDGNETRISYTIEEAQKADLTTSKNPNWKRRPDAMLRARCISKAVRMLAPEVVAGVYTPEEISDATDTTTRQVEPLLPTATASTAAPPENQKVIEVEIVKEPQAVDSSKPATAAGAIQGANSYVPAAATEAPKPFTAVIGEGGMLTLGTQQAIIGAIGEANMDELIKYLLKRQWLQDGQSIAFLTTERAQKILNNPAGVLLTIGAK